jgi:nitroreductase
MNNSETLHLLQNHASVRKYKDTEIPNETLSNLIHAAQHASSSNFVQAYSVIRITDEEKLEAIAHLSGNETQIKTAPVVLLFCADLKRVEHACQRLGVNISNDTVENFIVTVVDTSLFAQNFAVAAESKGYGICYIGGVRNNPTEISDLVALPEQVFPIFAMTVGVSDEEQWVKPRLPVEATLHENVYDETKYGPILDKYDMEMAVYYKERLSNNKDTNWSQTMKDYLRHPRRNHMKEFLKSKGFNLN